VEPEKLNLQNADELAQLMRESYPLMWGEMTGETVKILASPKEAVQIGIRVDDKLVSFGAGVLTEHVSIVTWLGTLEKFRRRGFCTSIISGLIREGLKKADFMAIHVLDENAFAWRIYESVGFKPYRSYVLVKT
jgi:predicted GNAT family acetyltransferase